MISLAPLQTGDEPTLLALLIGLLVASLATAVLAQARHARRPSRRLQQRIDRARSATRTESASHSPATSTSMRRQPSKTILGEVGRKLTRLLPRAEALRRRLDQGGWALNVVDYALLCAGGGILVGVVVHVLYAPPIPVVVGLGMIAASGVPHLLLERRIRKRRQQFLSQFPDAIDLIVRGVRSGIPVAEAMQAAGQELPNHVGALFQAVTGNVRLGKTLEESLSLAARALEVQELRFFIISLTIQQETGGNLAEILHNLGMLMRRREQMKLKIKAMSSEARASAMIIGSLPFIMFLVIYVIDPVYIMKLFLDPRGWLLLGGGLTSLSLGLGIMSKMVRFKI
jgi:tight adherence protein B